MGYQFRKHRTVAAEVCNESVVLLIAPDTIPEDAVEHWADLCTWPTTILPPSQQEKVMDLAHSYPEVGARFPCDVEKTPHVKVHLDTGKMKPIKQMPRRASPAATARKYDISPSLLAKWTDQAKDSLSQVFAVGTKEQLADKKNIAKLERASGRIAS